MIVLGILLLVAAVAIGVAGVVANGGAVFGSGTDLTVFGVHLTGSIGALYLAGIVVGAAGMLGLSLLVAGASSNRRAARHVRRQDQRSRVAVDAVGTDEPAVRDTASRTWKHPFGGGTHATPRPSH
ncbi:hypothetical protein [Prescottella sp. R16]|uniref:hypothetical protein n=1 Tax=Prescottella sp. R16 TaxID=3064529 RepID=UPI00272E87A3|nr:hypothetical protein [Prescottella sp. R16]